ncbi:3-deoxy-7-phosphoheptulonate synthase [Streptacidiphilus sp. EB129]|uniref:3-deoxy-7-phosphoheptulonate synthase n=1 Tax=Streptacidiphilus sp. EB129 TaxID=3156262 RepID=UPI0035114D5E
MTTWPEYPTVASGPVTADIEFLRTLPAEQQPEWDDQLGLDQASAELARMPALVEREEVRALRALLAEVAAGRILVLQAGDCAEDPAECTLPHIVRKAALLDILAGVMKLGSGKPVLRVGRIAGQFSKPRSRPTEQVDGRELPVFRGHLVNSPEPTAQRRRPQPERLLTGYRAARAAVDILRHRQLGGGPTVEAPVWTSHEALLLDYELPLLRRDEDGRTVLTSTHWPWIGDRTRQVDGSHVAMLAMVANPVACKVGPTMGTADLLALCEQLDPHREPGRLTLISRMGADAVGSRLAPLVEAVQSAGHPVIWLCDPMHGNTRSTPSGLKTRVLEDIVAEVTGFQQAVLGAGGVAGGLHLETTPEQVRECVAEQDRRDAPEGQDPWDLSGGCYTSACDPRLNPQQAITVASAWRY